jgi:hypothetical protein
MRLFGDIHLARDIRNQADDVIEPRGRNGEFLPELREIVIGDALMVEHLLVIPCGDFCAGSAGRRAFFFSFAHPIQSPGHNVRSPESLGFVERGQVVDVFVELQSGSGGIMMSIAESGVLGFSAQTPRTGGTDQDCEQKEFCDDGAISQGTLALPTNCK